MVAPKDIAEWMLGELKSLAIWPVSLKIFPICAVQMSIASGGTKALELFDKSNVDQIVTALNDAVVDKGWYGCVLSRPPEGNANLRAFHWEIQQ